MKSGSYGSQASTRRIPNPASFRRWDMAFRMPRIFCARLRRFPCLESHSSSAALSVTRLPLDSISSRIRKTSRAIGQDRQGLR